MIYRWRLGAIAWLLHRLSGVALAFYLVLHIWVTHNVANGADSFNKVMKFLASPLFKFLEIGLLGVILYHTLNGIRILIIDFFDIGAKIHKKLFYGVVVVGVILFLIGGIPLFKDAIVSFKIK